MKQSMYLIAALVFILTACNSRTSYNKELVRADSLMALQPDSALSILQTIPISNLTSEADSAYYALLLTQAQYKNYIKLTNDSVIQKAVSYYTHTGDMQMQAKAYYYLGCTFHEMNECDKSLKAYNEAVLLAKKIKEPKLLGLIYNSIAYLYQVQSMDQKADSIYHLTEQLAKQANDTMLWAESLTRQGIYSISLGKPFYKQAEELLLKSYHLSKSAKQLDSHDLSAATLSTLYSRMQNNKKALSFAKEHLSLQKNDSTDIARARLLLGDAYYNLEQYDSAKTYLNNSFTTDNNAIKEGASMRLADIARKQNDFEQALKWEEERNAYREKQIQSQQKTEITITEKEIVQEKVIQQYDSRLHTYFIYILIGSISVGGIFACIIVQAKKKRKNTVVTLSQEDNLEEELEKRLNTENFKNQISNNIYWLKMQRIAKYGETYSDRTEYFEKSDQKLFLKDIDTLLDNYSLRMKAKYPKLNDKDIFVDCLFLLDFSDIQIGYILDRDRSSIYRRRKNILEKKKNNNVRHKKSTIKTAKQWFCNKMQHIFPPKRNKTQHEFH